MGNIIHFVYYTHINILHNYLQNYHKSNNAMNILAIIMLSALYIFHSLIPQNHPYNIHTHYYCSKLNNTLLRIGFVSTMLMMFLDCIGEYSCYYIIHNNLYTNTFYNSPHHMHNPIIGYFLMKQSLTKY